MRAGLLVLGLLVALPANAAQSSLNNACEPSGIVAIISEKYDAAAYWAAQVKAILADRKAYIASRHFEKLDDAQARSNERFNAARHAIIADQGSAPSNTLNGVVDDTDRLLKTIDAERDAANLEWTKRCYDHALQRSAEESLKALPLPKP